MTDQQSNLNIPTDSIPANSLGDGKTSQQLPPGSSPSAQRLPPNVQQQVQYRQPPQPQERGNFKRGFGVGFGASVGFGAMMIIGSIISSLIMGMMLVGLAAVAKGSNTAETQPVETVWGKDGAKNVIRAVEIKGPILADPSDGSILMKATYGYEIARMIDNLEKNSYAGLALFLNTPGGTINGSAAIRDAVVRYKERTGHKVVAYVRGMSASGGMMAMSAADEIIADGGSLIGSVGVIMGPFSQYQNVKSVGSPAGTVSADKIDQFSLSEGKGKDFGTPFKDMDPEVKAHYQNGIRVEYEAFVKMVSEGRKIPAETIKNEYGAYMFDSNTAAANKYIDVVVSGPEGGFTHIAKTMGLESADTKIVKNIGAGGLLGLLGAERRAYGVADPAIAEAGDVATATASLCSGAPVLLAYEGNPISMCR